MRVCCGFGFDVAEDGGLFAVFDFADGVWKGCEGFDCVGSVEFEL